MFPIIDIGLPRLSLHLCHPLTSLGWPSSWLASLTGLSVAPIIPVLIGYLQCPPNQFIPLGCSHFLSCLFFYFFKKLNYSWFTILQVYSKVIWLYVLYTYILFQTLFYYRLLQDIDSPGEGNGSPLQYLAWRIPWTEEPGGLQSIGSQRVRHDWTTNTHTHTHTILTIVPCPV